MIHFTLRPTMPGKRPTLYLVLDCETATLPFVRGMQLTPNQRKTIAIAKPLIYDLAWRIVDRNNHIYAEKSYLISEIFSVPDVFNTAYYKEKRPFYLEKLRNKTIELVPWHMAIEDLIGDLQFVDYCCAYNAMFDFKKAIPFTALYMKHLYSESYQWWIMTQQEICSSLAQGNKPSNDQFDKDNFIFDGVKYPMIDIWGVVCNKLINCPTYKKMCLTENMLSPSGKFFKTSAESTTRYIERQYDFIESHTALEDVVIECNLLVKCLARGKIETGIIYFPFQELGYTHDFVRRYQKKEYAHAVIKQMIQYLDEQEKEKGRTTQYMTSIENIVCGLMHQYNLVY